MKLSTLIDELNAKLIEYGDLDVHAVDWDSPNLDKKEVCFSYSIDPSDPDLTKRILEVGTK